MVGHFKMYGEAVYIKLFESQRGIQANPLEPPLLPAYGPEYAGIFFHQLQNDDIGNTKISYQDTRWSQDSKETTQNYY